MTICPFCERDLFHYVDNGVGMEAVAVDCCGLGDLFFRGMRPAPEEVTLSWEEFTSIGCKISALTAKVTALTETLETIGAPSEAFMTSMSDPVIRGWAYAAAQVARDALSSAGLSAESTPS